MMWPYYDRDKLIILQKAISCQKYETLLTIFSIDHALIKACSQEWADFFPAGKGLVFISFLFSVECKSIISQIIGHMRFYDLVHSYVEQCMVLNLVLNTPLGSVNL